MIRSKKGCEKMEIAKENQFELFLDNLSTIVFDLIPAVAEEAEVLETEVAH